MYVDVPHLDCLLVAAPITLEGLDHLILKPKQLDGITAVYVDVVFGELLAKLDRAWLDSTLVGLKGNQRINPRQSKLPRDPSRGLRRGCPNRGEW
jgi:hypothetical protein